MAARAGSRGLEYGPFPQKYPISGCSSLLNHPRPHLGPSERQMGPVLSLPPMAGAEAASRERHACAHVYTHVGSWSGLPFPDEDKLNT